MSYIKYGFTLTDSQKEALQNAHQKHVGYALQLSHSHLSVDDFLNITRTQYNKITKAKTDCQNIELKLSKSQIAKNGGDIGAIVGKIMPHIIRHASNVLGTLRLAAASGGIQKAIAGSGKLDVVVQSRVGWVWWREHCSVV